MNDSKLKGVILAAGKGTRLYPVTHHIPKPLLPLANRPTLYYAFDRLKEMGVTDICVVVGEMERQMRDFLGDGSDQGVNLSYVRQEHPKGLAHAVSFAHNFVGEGSFVLYLGDAIYGSDFKASADKFRESGCANLNIVKAVEDPTRFGVANVEGERIVKLVEKPKKPDSNLAMAGLYFFGPQVWDVLPDLKPSARGEYEITDAIQMLIDRGETVLAGIYDGVWFDTGTLDSFLETSMFLTNGKSMIDPTASFDGHAGRGAVVGERAKVRCVSMEDSVILPGADVHVSGSIRHSIVAGRVHHQGSLESQIMQGES